MPNEWYCKFAKERVDDAMMFKLFHAANFLNITPLNDLMALKMTFCVIGKNTEEVSRRLTMLASCCWTVPRHSCPILARF